MSSTPRRGGLNSTALVLIPIAMAINIGIGTLIAGTPFYLDSIGTVLVGALLGPVPGMLTGLLSNAIWTYVFGNQYAFTFAPVAVVIGLLAGLAGRAGLFRRPSPRIVSAIVIGIFFLALTLFVFMLLGANGGVFPNAGDLIAANWPVFLVATLLGAAVGYFVLKNAGYAGIAGLLTGVVAALVSAPIAAYVFGGVTGGGTDALVAAFQSSGAGIWQSVLAQGTVSDPFDKMTSFMLVWLIIQAMPARMLQNFPLGQTERAADYDVLNTPRRVS